MTDSLLTPAQVADELHVTVCTVRRWITTGELRAAKAGPRRWTVRRSDLDRFLAADTASTSAADGRPRIRRSCDTWWVPMSVERAKEQLELSEGRWQDAVRDHTQPPPDAGFARRLRALADAAAQEQAAYRYADDQGFAWWPGPAWLPPRELRPAPRSSIAPVHVWERFDEAIERLSRARTGVSVTATARAFGTLSEAAWELAAAVGEQAQQARASQS